ncbi:MAG TPA: LysE family transporter, partial [Cyclobacteriaceae bacterium]|nr:LysE family transporter [Cyclobacteriaceae bacterium]
FLVAFAFSFIGSIPPGTINLTILQLGLEKKINIAWKFAFAASIVEYPYAWIAVKFANLILSNPSIVKNMHLIAGLVMIILGALNLWASTRSTSLAVRFSNSGFRKGLVLGILNPLAIPYWIAMTAYFKTQQWIDLSSNVYIHSYLSGVFLGAFLILIVIAYLANKLADLFTHSKLLKKIPGATLLVLGAYSLIQWLF